MTYLLPKMPGHGLQKFYGRIDNEKDWLENRKNQSITWEYRDKEVNYTLNSNGYRAAEWETIDWNNSYIMLGCSNIFGLGVDDSDTVSANLEKILNCPVINLGMNGGSISLILAITINLLEKNITPRGVIIAWPNIDRMLWWGNDYSLCLGPWTPYQNIADSQKIFYEEWIRDNNSTRQGQVFSKATKYSWKNHKIPFYEWNIETRKGFDIADNTLPHWGTNFARDFVHPGSSCTKNWADIIAKTIITNESIGN